METEKEKGKFGFLFFAFVFRRGRCDRDVAVLLIPSMSVQAIITRQGSENIWRKDYTPIEEAKLYYNYRKFLEKEQKRNVSVVEVATAFKVSEATVLAKIDLLELPPEIQRKLQRGELPFSKVRALSILTRENVPASDRSVGAYGTEAAPRYAYHHR
jgi:ParB-like chromosome segregation protein Spo0J